MRKKFCLLLNLCILVFALVGCVTIQSPTTIDYNIPIPVTTPTTEPTVRATEPIPTTIPGPAEVRVCQSMTVAKWQGYRLRFSYSLNQETFLPGDTIVATVKVTYLSMDMEIAGSFADQLSSIALMWHDNGYYGFTSNTNHKSEDTAVQTIVRGDTVTATYTFTVPDDVMEGEYYLTFGAFGGMVRFDGETAAKYRDMMVCGDLPDEVLIAMWDGDDPNQYVQASFKTRWNNRYKIFVFGAFDGVYVYRDEYGVDGWLPRSWTVNGLTFTSHDGRNIYVYSLEEDTHYSLPEAFDNGILSAEQLQITYDNYTYFYGE